jgi:hypothetical protein
VGGRGDAAAREHLAAVLAGRDALLVVPTNEQAAAASAAIHDRLVRLGLVEPGGVPLQAGTVAGVGDLVQYRRNDRRLCGVDGNTSWPANRATGRVVALRDDGGLVTAPVTGRDKDGAEILGAPLQLPARYVARHVALGYASTVHAAQGRTVDLCLSVAGTGTAAETLYVAMTRGLDGNVVFVVTRTTGPGAEPGEAHTVEPRPAESVLRDVIRGGQDHPNLAALQQQERSEAAERSPTVLIDALRQGLDLATAGRTGEVLDQLTTDGLLTVAQRQAIAADEAYPSLDHLARAAEAAGHDRGDVLAAAVARGSLDGSRSAAKVLHARVRAVLHGRMTPQLDSFHDLIPPATTPPTPTTWRRSPTGSTRCGTTWARRSPTAPTRGRCGTWGPSPTTPPPGSTGRTRPAGPRSPGSSAASTATPTPSARHRPPGRSNTTRCSAPPTTS